MKRKLALLGGLVLMASLAGWSTWAYFAGEAHTTNVITTGTIHIKLENELENDANAKIKDGKVVYLKELMPGVPVEKTVCVTNKNDDAWVRVKVTSTVTSASDEELSATLDGDPVVTFAYNSSDWLQGADGYYYYKTPMSGEEKSQPLFTAVTLNPNVNNDYQQCKVDVVIKAEAVQMKNNNRNGDAVLTKLETVEDLSHIAGWPADAEQGEGGAEQ